MDEAVGKRLPEVAVKERLGNEGQGAGQDVGRGGRSEEKDLEGKEGDDVAKHEPAGGSAKLRKPESCRTHSRHNLQGNPRSVMGGRGRDD